MNYTTRPPEKLSDLITLAITDARRLDRDLYVPCATSWHETRTEETGDTCAVCLAGCVIAGTLQAPFNALATEEEDHEEDIEPEDINDHDWYLAISSLDHARAGRWQDALHTRGTALDETTQAALGDIPPPEDGSFYGWAAFDAHLETLEHRAGRLRDLGL